MFSFDLRAAALEEQEAAVATPQQNVHNQWHVGSRYFASEGDARFWQKIEAQKTADRQLLQARVAARRELEAHLAEMARVQSTIRSLAAWCGMVSTRLNLEARVVALTRATAANMARVLPPLDSRASIEDAVNAVSAAYNVRLGLPACAWCESPIGPSQVRVNAGAGDLMHASPCAHEFERLCYGRPVAGAERLVPEGGS